MEKGDLRKIVVELGIIGDERCEGLDTFKRKSTNSLIGIKEFVDKRVECCDNFIKQGNLLAHLRSFFGKFSGKKTVVDSPVNTKSSVDVVKSEISGLTSNYINSLDGGVHVREEQAVDVCGNALSGNGFNSQNCFGSEKTAVTR